MTPTQERIKRALDIVVAGSVLIVSLPVQAVVAVAIRRSMGAPVLFRQPRPGKDGVIFELVKFRTMRHPDAEHVTDAERLTSLGRFLRSTSLDELPTLWNVLKGDMSLVGPRPLLVQYLPLYTPEQTRRHEIRPGVTGWPRCLDATPFPGTKSFLSIYSMWTPGPCGSICRFSPER